MAAAIPYAPITDHLCARCSIWDFEALFEGDEEHARLVGCDIDNAADSTQTFDRRPLEEVQNNSEKCKLCMFILSIVTTGARWKKAQACKSKLYLEYRKQWFAYRKKSPEEDFEEPITMLALELLDNWNPQECSSVISQLDAPLLQAFQFKTNHGDRNFERLLTGRRIEPELDFNLVQHWLALCDLHGLDCSNYHPASQHVRIRLIDVRGRRIIPASTSERYAALSYVWGPASIPQSLLTQSTLNSFSSYGSLADNNDAIPKTIRDAMIVCEKLSIAYLWVDALCIFQDSSDFERHLRKMNDIYASAFLTIVATCGTDSHAGLPGVRPSSRVICQPSIMIEDMEFGLALPGFWESVITSTWASRAWTFQERLFSNRMLMFTECQAFFVCGKTSHYESIVSENRPFDGSVRHSLSACYDWLQMRENFRAGLQCRLAADSLQSYFEIVREYRSLKLTYSQDVLNAFGGVTAMFEQQMSSPFYQGLPLSYFTRALLSDYLQCNRRHTFPSWSWTGWADDRCGYIYDTNIPLDYNHWLCNNSEASVVFYRLDQLLESAQHSHSWIFNAIEDTEMPRSADAQQETGTTIRVQPFATHLGRDCLGRLLLFTAYTSKLEVALDETRSTSMDCTFDIENQTAFGKVFGFSGDSYGPIDMDVPPYFSREWFNQKKPQTPLGTRWLEFILMAQESGTYHKSLVCLMLVETDEQGISSRVSFCLLEKAVWLQAKPLARRVILM